MHIICKDMLGKGYNSILSMPENS